MTLSYCNFPSSSQFCQHTDEINQQYLRADNEYKLQKYKSMIGWYSPHEFPVTKSKHLPLMMWHHTPVKIFLYFDGSFPPM